jgi:hypothetical protein
MNLDQERKRAQLTIKYSGLLDQRADLDREIEQLEVQLRELGVSVGRKKRGPMEPRKCPASSCTVMNKRIFAGFYCKEHQGLFHASKAPPRKNFHPREKA